MYGNGGNVSKLCHVPGEGFRTGAVVVYSAMHDTGHVVCAADPPQGVILIVYSETYNTKQYDVFQHECEGPGNKVCSTFNQNGHQQCAK